MSDDELGGAPSQSFPDPGRARSSGIRDPNSYADLRPPARHIVAEASQLHIPPTLVSSSTEEKPESNKAARKWKESPETSSTKDVHIKKRLRTQTLKDIPEDSFLNLVRVQSSLNKTLKEAYWKCASDDYYDEEVQELHELGLLPNGFVPVSPLRMDEGEALLLDDSV